MALFALAGLTLAALAVRFWRLGAMPLFGDEAYYLQYIDHPALAYVDHPAGIAVLLGISTAIGGPSEPGIRWLNALLSVACVPLAYAVGRAYVSRAGGLIAAAAIALGPVFVVTGRVTFPDALQAFLMLANLLALAPLLSGKDEAWRWVLFGLTLALLFNVKLSSAFYAAALVLFIVIWRADMLHRRGVWLAAGIAALGLVPVIGWNAAHDWLGVRWAMLQGNAFGLEPLPLRARLHHAWLYHAPGMILLAALGALVATVVLLRALVGRFGGQDLLPPPEAPGRNAGTGPASEDAGSSDLGSEDAGSSDLGSEDAGSSGLGSSDVGFPDAGPAPALLALVGFAIILPIVLSRANNARNFQLGFLAWLPLLGMLVTGSRISSRGGRTVLLSCPSHPDGMCTSRKPGASLRAPSGPLSAGRSEAISIPGATRLLHRTEMLLAMTMGEFLGSRAWPWLVAGGLVLLLAWNAIYGVGTAAEMQDYRERWPHSIAARSMSYDAASWPEFGPAFRPPPGSLAYAVGYSYAGQVQHYSGLPVYTNVPQQRLWGIPEFDALTVVVADALPGEPIQEALQAGFREVSGPVRYDYDRKSVRVWQANGRRVPVAQVLQELDYLRLAGEAWGTVR